MTDRSISQNTHVVNTYIYIYIYIERERERQRELGYDALQSTKTLCVLRSIFNFKLEMIDPNRSI
jgi:hypothetical protein